MVWYIKEKKNVYFFGIFDTFLNSTLYKVVFKNVFITSGSNL